MADFNKAFKFLMDNEGGWTNHKSDKGGATKYGITRKTLSVFLGHIATDADIFCMPLERAEAIYKKMFWDVMHLDGVNSDAIATALFDQGVNRGPQTVIKDVQRILGLRQDGVNGPGTTEAINLDNVEDLLKSLNKGALYAYKSIVDKDPSQAVFLTGWTNRANKLLELLS